MAACEKCWGDAYLAMYGGNYESQADAYHAILKEREATGHTCTQEEQDGQFYEKRQAERERSNESHSNGNKSTS